MQTKGGNMMEEAQPSAATRVFGITELAEQIIYDLPLRDLLVIQRVCPNLRDLVQGSDELKKRLYLTSSQSAITTLLPRELRPPHIRDIKFSLPSMPFPIMLIEDVNKIEISMNPTYQNRYGTESWRNMQIASRPFVCGSVCGTAHGGHRARRDVRSTRGGLTLGDLADAVHRMRQGKRKFTYIYCVLYADQSKLPNPKPKCYIYGKDSPALEC